MSFAPPPVAVAAVGPVNPLEALINGLNTNTYLIGLAMILLNLGGRHLSMGLTPEQDKFFQIPWIRRFMLFVVVFVATRNVFTALWMTIALIFVIGYLFNEHSDLYLFGEPKPLPPTVAPPPTMGLTAEETDIFKRLQDKVNKAMQAEEEKKAVAQDGEKKLTLTERVSTWYETNMNMIRGAF